MRKGIADLHLRAEVSQKANDRLLNALARVDDSRSVEELTNDIQKHTFRARHQGWIKKCLRQVEMRCGVGNLGAEWNGFSGSYFS